MELVGGEIIDRNHVAAIGLAGEQNAGVDGLIDETAVDDLAQHHRARPAIAFGTTFLCAQRALIQAQIVEQGQHRVEVVEPNFVTASKEPNFFAHSLSMRT